MKVRTLFIVALNLQNCSEDGNSLDGFYVNLDGKIQPCTATYLKKILTKMID